MIGASAGGVEALTRLLAGLPANLPAAVCVVVHSSPDSPRALAAMLDRSGPLPARYAVHDEPLVPGVVYVAPPDFHLLVADGRLRVVRGPRENGFRPAVDPLFRTAARAHGARVIGVVLSGGLDDGTLGLLRIQRSGGGAVVQDPEEALVPSMPASALRAVEVDHVLPVAEMPAALLALLDDPVTSDGEPPRRQDRDGDPAEMPTDALRTGRIEGPPSVFTCPDCGGSLWEREESGLSRFRCHLGHGYTDDGLVHAQETQIEDALWQGLRALEETARMNRRMAERAEGRRLAALADRYDRRAEDAERRADVIRRVLFVEREAAREVAVPEE